mmetsp:Transcript_27940/g.67724  ORF Transcript_27940/g.67724 Transcript_27940/m.67724 type:complete len:293 (+) Transcript_27940:3162-4040(+)
MLFTHRHQLSRRQDQSRTSLMIKHLCRQRNRSPLLVPSRSRHMINHRPPRQRHHFLLLVTNGGRQMINHRPPRQRHRFLLSMVPKQQSRPLETTSMDRQDQFKTNQKNLPLEIVSIAHHRQFRKIQKNHPLEIISTDRQHHLQLLRLVQSKMNRSQARAHGLLFQLVPSSRRNPILQPAQVHFHRRNNQLQLRHHIHLQLLVLCLNRKVLSHHQEQHHSKNLSRHLDLDRNHKHQSRRRKTSFQNLIQTTSNQSLPMNNKICLLSSGRTPNPGRVHLPVPPLALQGKQQISK